MKNSPRIIWRGTSQLQFSYEIRIVASAYVVGVPDGEIAWSFRYERKDYNDAMGNERWVTVSTEEENAINRMFVEKHLRTML